MIQINCLPIFSWVLIPIVEKNQMFVRKYERRKSQVIQYIFPFMDGSDNNRDAERFLKLSSWPKLRRWQVHLSLYTVCLARSSFTLVPEAPQSHWALLEKRALCIQTMPRCRRPSWDPEHCYHMWKWGSRVNWGHFFFVPAFLLALKNQKPLFFFLLLFWPFLGHSVLELLKVNIGSHFTIFS